VHKDTARNIWGRQERSLAEASARNPFVWYRCIT